MEIDNSKNELVAIARKLKQKDKIKIFNVILNAYENNENVEDELKEALSWCNKLCDLNR